VKTAVLFILGIASVGCSTIPKTGNPAVATPPAYLPATAAALAFDPPVTLAGPMVDLSRDGRRGEAFVGFEDAQIETGYVYQRDQQRDFTFGGGRFDRTAYSTRQTTITR
jgi:hypothetical protein